MKSLLDFIYQTLSSIYYNTYFELAPEQIYVNGAWVPLPYPYVVYRMDTSNKVAFREDFFLEVDIWDRTQDTTNLESITDQIKRQFNYLHYTNNELGASFYLINRMMIDDPDPEIRRRQLRFQVKTYFVEG